MSKHLNRMLTDEICVVLPSSVIHVAAALGHFGPQTRKELKRWNLSSWMISDGTRLLEVWGIVEVERTDNKEKLYRLHGNWSYRLQYSAWHVMSRHRHYKGHVSAEFDDVPVVGNERMLSMLSAVSQGLAEFFKPTLRAEYIEKNT